MVAHFQTDTYSTCWPSSRSLWHRWWAKARACFGQGLGQGRGNGFEGFEGPQLGLQFWTCWKVQHLNRKIIYNHLGPTSPSPAASLACPTPSDVQQSDVQQKGRWKKNIYISKRTAFHRHVWWPEGTFPMKMNGPGWKQLPISIGPGTGPSWGSIGWNWTLRWGVWAIPTRERSSDYTPSRRSRRLIDRCSWENGELMWPLGVHIAVAIFLIC